MTPPMVWATPSWPIQAAVETAIQADTTLAGLLKGSKTYSSIVDTSTSGRPMPFIVYAETSEEARNTFARGGHDTRLQMQILAADKYQVLRVYNALKKLLSGVTLPLQDHTSVQGTVELIMTFPEPDLSGERGIVEYSVFSLTG